MKPAPISMELLALNAAPQMAQALASLLLAVFILLILRSRHRDYLRRLALSFLALAVFLGAGALTLADLDQALSGFTIGFSVLALSALFPHLIWLWLGARGALRQGSLPATHAYLWVLGGAVAGALLAVSASMLMARNQTMAAAILSVTFPYTLAGLVYIALAARLFRQRSVGGGRQISPIIGVLSFSALGLYLLYVAVFGAELVPTGPYALHTQLADLAGLILLMMIALSLVSWLLEVEQMRSEMARVQAQAAEQRLSYMRSHDPATGLPNRRQMHDIVRGELKKTRRSAGRSLGVLALGLHRYKMMSESMGLQQTEELMRDLTRRIQDDLPPHFVLGRTSERDFVLLMPRIKKRAQAEERARRIVDRLRLPFEKDGRELFLKVTGGLSLAPEDTTDPIELIKLAERAQLQAVTQGETLLVHQPRGDHLAPRDLLQVETELRQAQRRGEFKLYFQPIISIPQRRISGFEALLRWEHPQHGLLGPADFLDDAAALGVLDELEDMIFDQALQQLRAWCDDLSLARSPIIMSINVSAERFVQPDLSERLTAQCQRLDIDPGMVMLEITESCAIEDFEAGVNTIARLRERGIKVGLDDFGTGYSALAHLQRLKVDCVKLDRTFIKDIESDERQLALTRAIVSLIHSLGMKVLAEGVETREQLGHLLRCRVDYVQGFLLGRPQPAEAQNQRLEQPLVSDF